MVNTYNNSDNRCQLTEAVARAVLEDNFKEAVYMTASGVLYEAREKFGREAIEEYVRPLLEKTIRELADRLSYDARLTKSYDFTGDTIDIRVTYCKSPSEIYNKYSSVEGMWTARTGNSMYRELKRG